MCGGGGEGCNVASESKFQDVTLWLQFKISNFNPVCEGGGGCNIMVAIQNFKIQISKFQISILCAREGEYVTLWLQFKISKFQSCVRGRGGCNIMVAAKFQNETT